MPDRRLIASQKDAAGNEVRVYEGYRIEELYVDAVPVIQTGASLTKLTLTHIVPTSEGAAHVEQSAFLRLVMPTRVLAEICQNVLASLNERGDAIEGMLDQEKALLLRLIGKS